MLAYSNKTLEFFSGFKIELNPFFARAYRPYLWCNLGQSIRSVRVDRLEHSCQT